MFLLLLQTIESEDDRSFVIDLYDQHYRRLLKEANFSNIIKLLFPFRYPINPETLILGGMLTNRCT